MSPKTARPRRYLPAWMIWAARPLFRFSHQREAYVLRFVGHRVGPVLRQDRRGRQLEFKAPDRRGSSTPAESTVSAATPR